MTQCVWLFNDVKPQLWTLIVNEYVTLNYCNDQHSQETHDQHAHRTNVCQPLESSVDQEYECQEDKIDGFH